MDKVTAYAKLIVSGRKLCGHAEYLACKRHLDDMSRGKGFKYVFDAEEAERHIEIANTLVIGEGAKKKPLHLRGFQEFIIGSLFGWREKHKKVRRFREAYVQMGRQNGKSFLAGTLCNDFATFSGYRYGRIFCTATKQDQANIVWTEVDKFIESDPELAELYKVKEYEHTITSMVTGCTIRAIGRDTKSADGFRSILAIIDEYHAHPTDQMYKLMLDGQITVPNALTIAITTAGFNLNSPCYEQYQFCKKVLAGAIEKDSLFCFICEMDEGDDIWDKRNWAKANPFHLWNTDNTLNKEMCSRLAEKAVDAREKQGQDLVNFLTKSLDRWVTYTGGALVDAEKWAKCSVDYDIAAMANHDAYLGIDLSSGGDLTSIALVFPLSNGNAYVWSKSYMPEMRLAEHMETDNAPYGEWHKHGLLTLTSGVYGVKTDYHYIISDLANIKKKYGINIVGCGYDNHNASAFLADLDDVLDCDLTEVKQSCRSLNDCTKDFQLSVEAGIVEYYKGNDLLNWSVLNAIISEPNSFGEIKVDKMNHHKRIDPVDAIIDAWKVWFANKQHMTTADILDEWLEITQPKEVKK